MDFSQVKAITIPEGNVLRILSGTTVLWERTGLPAEYQQVEYIESTGTQYIDTGMVLNNGCVITLDFLIAESATNRTIYGWRRKGTYTQPYQAMVGANASKTRYIAVGRASTNVPQCFNYNVRNKVLIDCANSQVLVNNLVVNCGADFSNGKAFDENGSSEYHPYLFALNNAGTPLAISKDSRIYGYSVQYDGELLQSFVPCYRKIDKVAGMYDVVNGVFYTNAGTGEFNVGADVIVLPADYQRVEYIRSANDGGQWIDTGVPGENSNLRIDVSYMWDVVPVGGSYQNIISAYINETSNCTRIIQYAAGTTYVDVNIRANRSPVYRSTRVAGTRYNESLTRTYYDVNGERLVLTETVTGSSNNHNLHLFSSSTHSAFAKSLRLYNCKLYDGNTIVRDFVPCYRKIDKVAGLYDVVNDVFYPNGGTGSFTVGPDIITIPSEYQKVEYIQSSGTQYIRTPVPPSDDFRMDLKVYTTCVDSFYCAGLRIGGDIIFGQTGPTANNRVTASVNGSSATASTDGVQWSRSSSGQTYEIMLRTNGDGTFTYHIEDLTNEKEFLAENRPYDLMGDRTNGVCISALNSFYILNGTNQFYYFRLYKNGEVAFDGIPCYRKSDNVVGLYDLVSKTLLVNAGTGSFTAGPDV